MNILKALKKRVKNWINESPSTRNPKLIWYVIRKKGISGLFRPYNYDFYSEHFPIRTAYSKLALHLQEIFSPQSLCDFGCGNGYIIAEMFKFGIKIAGFEGNENAISNAAPEIKNFIRLRNLVMPLKNEKYDVVISTEVAEHIPKKFSQNFVNNLCETAGRVIIFTAAAPGQWGDGHINCQPQSFWYSAFEKAGWKYNQKMSATLIQKVKVDEDISKNIPWMLDNFMVFTK